MKPNMLTGLTGLLSLSLAAVAGAQQPTLYYDFESVAGGAVPNLGSLGGNGTLTGGNGNELVGGAPGAFTPGTALKLDQKDLEFIDTGLASAAIGFNQAAYTASAWVKLDSVSGDNMVFGQTAGNYLHDGFRGPNQHMGHFGADATSGVVLGTGTWSHYAWTQYNGGVTSQGQTKIMWENGMAVAANNSGLLNNTDGVIVGRGGGGGGLVGSMDDAAVYATDLRPNQIQFLAAGGNPLALPAGTGYLPATLSGPSGTVGNFGIKYVSTGAGLQMVHIDAAVSALQNSGATNGTIVATGTTTSPVLNFNDPDAVGTVGIFGGDLPHPGNTAAGDDNFAYVAKGKISIPETGEYTFQVHSDDGFALRIAGQTFTSITGPGTLDPRDASTVAYVGGTGDSNTLAKVTLNAGTYDLDAVFFEGGGGASSELSVANSNGIFNLVGATTARRSINPGVSAAGWSVTTSTPGGTTVDSIATGQADIAAGSTVQNGVASLNFNDPDAGGPGSIAGDVPFEGTANGLDDNDFAVKALATLVIPEDGTYQFGFQGDDGGYLRILGVSGWNLIQNQTGNARVADANGTANTAGDTLWADVLTGNSRTVGEISLTAGNYDIEAFFFERGGGAYFEVFGGSQVAGLSLLTANGAYVRDSAVVALVPEPSSALTLLSAAGLLGLARRRRK